LHICISKINPTKTRLENPYRFSVKEYCALADVKIEGMHQAIKRELRNFQSKVLIKYDEGLGRERIYNWTEHIDCWDNNNTYDIYFHKELEADLVAKSRYTSYLLEAGFRLKSKYSLRLYEICKKWEAVGKTTISIETLRSMLGVSDDEYKQYAMFKKRCLKRAVDEISDNTEVSVSFIEMKKGKAVDSVELIIKRGKPKHLPGLKDLRDDKKKEIKDSDKTLFDYMDDENEGDDLIERLKEIRITRENAIKLLSEFNTEDIEEELKYVLANNDGKHAAGIMITRLRDNKAEIEAKKLKAQREEALDVVRASHREFFLENRHRIKEGVEISDVENRYVSISYTASGRSKNAIKPLVYGSDDFEETISKHFEPEATKSKKANDNRSGEDRRAVVSRKSNVGGSSHFERDGERRRRKK